ncbi:MAG: hypothetical protein ABW221_11260 [Vicinamibacteria bacterium]
MNAESSGGWRGPTAGAVAAAALALAAVAVLDPQRIGAAPPALGLAALSAVLSVRAHTFVRWAAGLAAAWAIAACVGPEFRGDAGSYFVYLRSAAFDRDLDFTNDWEGLERPPPPATAGGRPGNTQSVGPALAWSPFFGVAHAYVLAERAQGRLRYAADGFSTPYRRAPVLGTLAALLGGVLLLGRALARAFGPRVGWLSVAATATATPVLYYALVVPAMAHGLTFAASAALLWACLRSRERPGPGSWALVGALLGAAALVRWQAAVWGLFVAVLAIVEWRRGRARAAWIAGAAGLTAVLLLPQLAAWHALYGRFLTVPQGPGYMDWRAPHLADVLLSADHGLFAWTPLAWLGLAGLVACWRRDRTVHTGALLVLAATAWVNGSVTDWDWAAGDAFGARRFDLAMPLVAWGLATLLAAVVPLLARRPLLLPAALLAVFAAWNVGLVALFREGRHAGAAPIDVVAGGQARLGRDAVLSVAGTVGGARARALAYKHLSGEYLFGLHPDGVVELAAEERLLREGWSARANRSQAPHFRWALWPRACLLLPLASAHDVTLEVTARAPRRALPQSADATWNDAPLATTPLTAEWQTIALRVPKDRVRAGENSFCLAFASAADGDEGGRVAAAVATVRLSTD